MCDFEWPRLIGVTLIRRYQRFKADVKLKNGHLVTALCPNTGSMRSCSEPGRPVYLSRHNHPHRKLKYTWEMIEMPTSLVGINTWLPNRLVESAIRRGKVKSLNGYDSVKSEVRYGRNSRIDLLLETGQRRCFVEVKNCTLVEDGIVSFPDAVTARGLKHLRELQRLLGVDKDGRIRCAMFYLVQRMDALRFELATRIDPAYGKELKRAVRRGVEILVYDVRLDLTGIQVNGPLPYDI